MRLKLAWATEINTSISGSGTVNSKATLIEHMSPSWRCEPERNDGHPVAKGSGPCESCLSPLCSSEPPWTQPDAVQNTQARVYSLQEGTQGHGDFRELRAQGAAGAGTGRGLCSFAHPSSLPSSPETIKFDTVSVGDAEPWRPGLRRRWGCGGCDSCQAVSRTDPRLSHQQQS